MVGSGPCVPSAASRRYWSARHLSSWALLSTDAAVLYLSATKRWRSAIFFRASSSARILSRNSRVSRSSVARRRRSSRLDRAFCASRRSRLNARSARVRCLQMSAATELPTKTASFAGSGRYGFASGALDRGAASTNGAPGSRRRSRDRCAARSRCGRSLGPGATGAAPPSTSRKCRSRYRRRSTSRARASRFRRSWSTRRRARACSRTSTSAMLKALRASVSCRSSAARSWLRVASSADADVGTR